MAYGAPRWLAGQTGIYRSQRVEYATRPLFHEGIKLWKLYAYRKEQSRMFQFLLKRPELLFKFLLRRSSFYSDVTTGKAASRAAYGASGDFLSMSCIKFCAYILVSSGVYLLPSGQVHRSPVQRDKPRNPWELVGCHILHNILLPWYPGKTHIPTIHPCTAHS